MSAYLAIVLPPVWAQVYLGAARFLKYSLEDLGISTQIVDFDFYDSSKSVILGWHLMPENFSPRTPYAIYQLEPMVVPHWREKFTSKRRLFDEAVVIWDYSEANLEYFQQVGLNPDWMPITFHPKLRDAPAGTRLTEYDVLFTGFLTSRRKNLIDRLSMKCCVFAHSRWGSELIDAFTRSKIVLNVHQYDLATPVEQPRVSYALNQGSFVLSEKSADGPYPFLPICDYDSLAETALELLHSPAKLKAAHQALTAAFEITRSCDRLSNAMTRLRV